MLTEGTEWGNARFLVKKYYPTFKKELEEKIRIQLRKWWSIDTIDTCYLLKIYRIKYAQPAQNPPYNVLKPSQIAENLFCCGDYMNSATLNGAIESGIFVANEVTKSL